MKKILIAIAVLVMTIAICVAVSGANVTEFSDVTEEHWAYETIMDMTEAGLFKGTSEPVNGVGTFSPEKQMTRAEFITVALRSIYPEEAGKINATGKQWWLRYYRLALDKGLLNYSELDFGNLDLVMNREEMAMIMVRCVELNGERLTNRVPTSMIADYDIIGDGFKDYIRDCFSYGLLEGVDTKGTFAPTRSLTRAQAATALCRLLDKDKRVQVKFGDETGEDDTPNSTDTLMPWEKSGAKKPENYTWEEYEKLTSAQKIAFQDYFDAGDFEKWLDRAWASQNDNPVTGTTNPWDRAGAKQPKDYTWAEYVNLTSAQQIAFRSHLGTEGFTKWLDSIRESVQEEPEEPETIPWEEPGAKQPEDYTWEEFEALSGTMQMEFQNYLGREAFDKWMQKAQGEEVYLPWEDGGKAPERYTYPEFAALDPAQQMAFQNSFDSFEAFDEWLREALAAIEEEVYLPWEHGGKDPLEYSYKDFEKLNPGQQMAFQNYLGEEAFDEWLRRVREEDTGDDAYIPWEHGGKDPWNYSWDEFEDLNEAQQMAFQNYLGEERFAEWMEMAKAEDIYIPWEHGGKDPWDYSYDEFEDLNEAQQMAFQNYLGRERFDEWLRRVREEDTDDDEYLPWEHGGKDPRDYSWDEFNDLSMAQQMAFQNYLGESGFEEWLNRNQP